MDLWDMLFRALFALTVLTMPIRIGVRVAQWRRRRANEAPLGRFWTHPAWLVYEAVLGSMAGYILYRDALHIITRDSDYLAVNGIWRWSYTVLASLLAAFFLRYEIRAGTMSEEEWRRRDWEEWHEKQREDWEEYWKKSNDFTTGTGSYTYMRYWYDRD